MNINDYFMTFNDRNVNSIIDEISKSSYHKFNGKDLNLRKKEIAHLSIIDSTFRSIVPLKIKNQFVGVIEDKCSKVFHHNNQGIWKTLVPCYINLDTGFKIWDIITSNKYKSVLNFGTGWGSSLIYSSIGLSKNGGGKIITIEHIPLFTEISKYIYDFTLDLGMPLVDMVDYINCDIIPFKNHNLYNSCERFVKSKHFKKRLINRKTKHEMSAYNVNFNEKFDFAIIDGPPFFRFPSFLMALNFVKDDGTILFEGCRQEVAILKSLNIKLGEYGRRMRKKIKFVIGSKKNRYDIYSTSFLKVTKKIKEYFLEL